ncbi:FkbM family methyltransferase [Crocosphaera sp. XPORK-15E]|uniref:FkbM family methyltransferase n=1 Tax=Crocosphaera sp. XPORK-15E TaxID=3110247 RepID=UPI002B1F0220|nr:FkbM family methyltransferase [Crocosphaera sp. XPORK-15E]MEA5532670.1 FkbM family methyltransferase [Crocosphaera sp. XPORK-15E]
MIKFSGKKIKNLLKKIERKYHPKYQINFLNQGMINLIDVGSIGGLPSPWNTHANCINFLLNFEPNEAIQKGKNFMTYNTALWESEETLPFYIYKGFNATGSSLFQQNYEYVQNNWEILSLQGPKELAETWFERSELVETKTLKCRSLDQIINAEFSLKTFHFLKIDAQGAEYNILKGASEFLSKSCVGLHLELFVIPLYKEIALLTEVESYLNNFGFKLIKKFPPHGTFNSQHDCIFINESRNPQIASKIRKIYQIDH